MENRDSNLQEQIEVLKKQNEELLRWKAEVDRIMEVLPAAFKNINEAIHTSQHDILACGKNIFITESYLEKALNNREYELLDPRRKVSREKYFYPKMIDVDTTIDLIIREGKSLARFGDGEFGLMEGKARWSFQPSSEKLQERLIEVIRSKEENLLLGIADNYGMLDAYDLEGASTIRAYMTTEIREIHRKYLEENREYCDAYITRPYMMYADKNIGGPERRFNRLKMIWENRNVLIVEGAQTRFGARNDLLQGALSVRRILAPATDSFSRYEEVLESAFNNAQKGDLCLVALGPCAGVLAYDLCKNGIQAIDVGHMDLEYEWFLKGEGKRTRIPYKYCNEVQDGSNVEEYHDPVYESQIIAEYL